MVEFVTLQFQTSC